jgi:hypothetical protein
MKKLTEDGAIANVSGNIPGTGSPKTDSPEDKNFAAAFVNKKKNKSPVMTRPEKTLKRNGLQSFGEWFDLQRNTDDPGHSD